MLGKLSIYSVSRFDLIYMPLRGAAVAHSGSNVTLICASQRDRCRSNLAPAKVTPRKTPLELAGEKCVPERAGATPSPTAAAGAGSGGCMMMVDGASILIRVNSRETL